MLQRRKHYEQPLITAHLSRLLFIFSPVSYFRARFKSKQPNILSKVLKMTTFWSIRLQSVRHGRGILRPELDHHSDGHRLWTVHRHHGQTSRGQMEDYAPTGQKGKQGIMAFWDLLSQCDVMNCVMSLHHLLVILLLIEQTQAAHQAFERILHV